MMTVRIAMWCLACTLSIGSAEIITGQQAKCGRFAYLECPAETRAAFNEFFGRAKAR